MVLLVGVFQVFSCYSFLRPISDRMSASSLSGQPRCVFTLINKVASFACTRCCSLMTMSLIISASAVFVRLSLDTPPIHLFMSCRVDSLSVRYNRFSLSGCASRHYQRATSSCLLELRSSPSRPTLCDCFVLCSYRRFFSVTHFSELKL